MPDGLHKDVEVTNTSSNFYTVSVSRSHESQNGNYFTMMPGESKNWARSYQGTDPYEPSRFYIMTVTSHLSEKAYLVKAGNRIVIDNDGVLVKNLITVFFLNLTYRSNEKKFSKMNFIYEED